MTPPNSPVSLPTDEQLDAAEAAYDAEPEGADAHRRGLGRAYLAMKAVRPKEQVEGLVERVCNSLDKMIERWVQGERPTDEEGKEATEALMALTRRMPAISQPSSPEVIRAPDGLDESHYRGLAGGVPVSSNEDAEWLRNLAKHLNAEHGKHSLYFGSDTERLNRIANTLEAKPVASEQVSVRVEPATAQTLMDWNVLHFTDEGWTIDLDIWRQAKPGITLDEARERYAEEMQRGF